jgi:hypothetical protein
MIRYLMLTLLLPVLAWAGTEELRPNGDQSIDTAFDTIEGDGDTCGTPGSGNCWQAVDENFSTACTDVDGNDILYDDCTVSNQDSRDRFNLTNPVTEAGNVLSGNQTIQICVAECRAAGNPTTTIEVYCSGDADGTPQTSDSAFTVSNGTTMVSDTFTFDASALSCADTPDDVEVAIFCDGVGGAPGNRNGCQIGLIEFQGNFEAAAARNRIIVVD